MHIRVALLSHLPKRNVHIPSRLNSDTQRLIRSLVEISTITPIRNVEKNNLNQILEALFKEIQEPKMKERFELLTKLCAVWVSYLAKPECWICH